MQSVVISSTATNSYQPSQRNRAMLHNKPTLIIRNVLCTKQPEVALMSRYKCTRRHCISYTYRVVQKSRTPVLILRYLPQMYTDFNLFYCYNKKCMTHKSTRNVSDCNQSNYSSRIIFSCTFTLQPNMKSIGRPVPEIWPFEIFQDGGQPPSWIWSNRK